MSSQAVGHSLSSRPILLPAEPRSQSTLPSPVSRTVASVVTGDGTQWIFYYNAQSIISYQKITANGKSTRSQLNVESKPVVGGPNDSLAVTLIEDTHRIYYIDQEFIIREIVQITGDNWGFGGRPAGGSTVYVNTGLNALGDGDHLPGGTRLRVLFHEGSRFQLWVAADYSDSTSAWSTKPLLN